MSTLKDKLLISVVSAIIFIVVNLPKTYELTSKITSLNLYNAITGCPTNLGILVHTIVFFVLTYLSMWGAPQSSGLKLKFSLYGTLIFYLISSPVLFSLMNSLLGEGTASVNGCPTVTGVILGGAIYCMVLVAFMYLPPEVK